MEKMCLYINGGATVARRFDRFRVRKWLGSIIMLLLLQSSSVFAQGSIFGAVRNNNLSTPANGEISFYGFTNNADNEIRLESSVGAGYDAGNWFDDFQNYLAKTPGSPYQYRFFNSTNGQGAVLAKTIPSNSFQQEDIALNSVTWPAAPGGMAGRVISSTSVVLTWTRVAGMTYHVYRRASTSGGSFFRIDNPAGLLSAAGVADSFFVDNTVSGGASFDYLLIAQDAGANLGPHSAILTVSTAAATAPAITSISPNSGSAFGGTAVVIRGAGFDVNGATATIGGAAMTSVTVVSPYQINAVTPSGTAGAANLIVLNTSSVLSATLTGGYTYLGNVPPVLAPIGPKTVNEGANLNFTVTATDPDGTIPILTTSTLPANATFVDNHNGTGTFNFNPNFSQAGTYNVTFRASDGIAIDTEIVVITVNNVNQRPVMTAIGPQTVNEGQTLTLPVSATDPDGTIPALTTSLPLPTNASFVDHANGTGTFVFSPNFTQSGSYTVTFFASDGLLKDSQVVAITVVNVNRAPVMTAIGPQTVAENATLTVPVSATDPDGTIPALTTSLPLPTHASFVDNLNGTGTFTFSPDFTQAGSYSVTFFASDGTLKDSQVVAITVTNTNRPPVMTAIGPQTVAEGATLTVPVTATDPDGTVPTLTTTVLPTNASFTDHLNGTGTFTFAPDFTQAGSYSVTFFASDGLLKDSQIVSITVTNTNRAPVMAVIGAKTVAEGTTLTVPVSATDPDGTTPTLSTSLPLPTNASFVNNLNGTGTFTFSPVFGQSGNYTVIFFASDGFLKDSQVVAITVVKTNRPPVMTAIGAQAINQGQTLTIPVAATDPDGTIPTLTTSTPLPANASFVDHANGTGTFTFTPAYNQTGPVTVTFFASDGLAKDSQIVAITINLVNVKPVMTAIGPQTVSENQVLTLPVTATDANGTTPVLTTSTLPLNASFVDNLNGTGAFTFSPLFGQAGLYSVTFFASDGTLKDSQIVAFTVVHVNRPPAIALIGNKAVVEGQNLNFVVTAVDPDGTIPSLTTSTLPANATFADNGNGTGTFNFNPNFTQAGAYSVTFYASDGVARDSQVVGILVNDAGNQKPVLAAIGNKTVPEGQTLTFAVSATDPDGTIPALSASPLPTNAVFVDSTTGKGSFTFTPGYSQAGIYNINFVASDGSLADTLPVVVTVTDVGNVAPVFVTIPDTMVYEGGTLLLHVVSTDPDGGSVYPALSVTTSLKNYTFVDSANGHGLLTYTPNYFNAGPDTVRFFSTDFGTPRQTAVMRVAVATLDVNRPPSFKSVGPFSLGVGDSLAFTLVATDSTDPNPFARLFLSAVDAPVNAQFVDNGNNTGTYRFVPTSAQIGTDTVNFLAVDQGAPPLSSTLPVIVTVVTVNRPPVITPIGPKVITEGQPLSFTVTATDPDGTTPALTADGAPYNAIFTPTGPGTGLFQWTPNFVQGGNSGKSKLWSVTFKASDGAAIGKEVVVIQVKDAGNQSPVFDTLPAPSVTEGQSLVTRIRASDPDSTPVTLSAITSTLPTGATFADSGNGLAIISFSPDFRQSGIYSVSVIVSDGAKADTGVVVITVIDAGNQVPVLDSIATPRTVKEMLAFSFRVSATDVDGPAPHLSTSTPLPGSAVFTDSLNGHGSFVWTTNNFNAGTYPIMFYAQDAVFPSALDSQLVTLIVLDSNLRPTIITLGGKTINEGDTLRYAVYGVDPDSTFPKLRVRLQTGGDTLARNMSFVDSANGTGVLTFAPDYTQGSVLGTFYYLRFYAKDAIDTTLVDSSATIQIKVMNKNAPPTLVFLSGTGPFTILEGTTLSFDVGVTDVDGTIDVISTGPLPANANYSASLPNYGTFNFSPDYTQAGSYTVRIIGTDPQNLQSYKDIVINVTDAGNQAPKFSTILPDTINFSTSALKQVLVHATDPERGRITLSAAPVLLAASFVDSGNGSGVYTWLPDLTNIGTVTLVQFTATDSLGAATTISTHFRVLNFLRGDLDFNNKFTLNDLALLVGYLFRNASAPKVLDAADINGDGKVDIEDVSYMVNFLYYSGPRPPQ
jgi:hypothetical protein